MDTVFTHTALRMALVKTARITELHLFPEIPLSTASLPLPFLNTLPIATVKLGPRKGEDAQASGRVSIPVVSDLSDKGLLVVITFGCNSCSRGQRNTWGWRRIKGSAMPA